MSEKQLASLEAEAVVLTSELTSVQSSIPASEACTNLYTYMNASEIEGGAPEFFTLPVEGQNPYHQPVGAGGGCCSIS